MKLAEAFVEILARDETDAVFSSVEGKTRGFVGNLSSSLLTLGTGAVLAGATAAAGAVVGIGVAAFNGASQVQGATNLLTTQLGLSEEKAQSLGDVIRDVYGNNFGESIAAVGEAVGIAGQQFTSFGEMANGEIQAITENAFGLQDAFGADLEGSMNAANALMTNFGMSSAEAFDFITAGYQRGLDSSGDFLESITEYSTQFSNGGANAGQFFSVMESGLSAGMLGTDKAADMFKEFTVRIQDGSTSTSEALGAIGLDAEAMAAGFADGSLTAAEAFDMVQGALNETDNANTQFQAGVALMGTQFEDLGTSAALGIGTATTSMGELAGATDDLAAQYDDFGSMWEGLGRSALMALEPIGEILLDLANRAMPLLNDAFAWFESNVVPAIEAAADVLGDFIDNIDAGMTPIDAIKEALANFIPPEVMGIVETFIDLIANHLTTAMDNAKLAIDAIKDLFNGDFAGAFENVQGIVENVIEEISTAFESLGDLIMPMLEDVWNRIVDWAGTDNWGEIAQLIANGIGNKLGEAAGIIGEKLVEWNQAFLTWAGADNWGEVAQMVANGIGNHLAEAAGIIGEKLVEWNQAFLTWAGADSWGEVGNQIAAGIGDAIASGKDIVVEKANEIKAAIETWAGTSNWLEIGGMITEAIGEGLAAAVNSAIDFLGMAQEWYAGFLVMIRDIDFADLGYKVTEFLIDAIVIGIGSLVTGLAAVFDTIANFLTNLEWKDIGKFILDGIIQGVLTLGVILEAAAEFASGIFNAIKDALGIASPSTMFVVVGEAILLGVVEGLKKLFEWGGIVGEWLAGIVAAVGGAIDTIKGIGTAIVNGIINGLQTAAGGLADAVKGIAQGAVQAAKEALGIQSPSTVFAEMGAMLMAGLAMGISENAGQPTDALAGVAGMMSAEGAVAFADALQSVVASVGPAIDAMMAIFNFDSTGFRQGFEAVLEFADLVGALTNAFAQVASELSAGSAGYALSEAEAMASAASAVAGMVLEAIGALEALVGFNVPDVRPAMHLFIAQIDSLVTLMVLAANDISGEALAHAEIFADAAGAIFDIIESGIAAIEQLAAIVTIENIHSQLLAFASSIQAIVSYIADVAVTISGEALAHAEIFADAAGAIFDIIESGIAAIEQLAAIVTIENIHSQLSAFASSIQTIVSYIADVAVAISGEALAHAEIFADAAGAIFDLIVPGIEAIQTLADYVAIGAGQISGSGFALDLYAAIQELVTAFNLVAQYIGSEAVAAAAAISVEAETLLGVVEVAVGALLAIVGYEAAGFYEIASGGLSGGFALDLYAAIQELVTAFNLVAQYIGSEAVAAAAAIASEAEVLLGIVEIAIAAIAAIVAYEAAEIGDIANSGLAVDLANAVQELVSAFSLIGATIGGEALTAAAEMAASVDAVASTVSSTLDMLAAIGASEMPDTSAAMAYLLAQAQIITTALTSSSATLNGSVVAAAQDFASNMELVVAAVEAALATMDGLIGSAPGSTLQAILDAMVNALSNRMSEAWATIASITQSGGATVVAIAQDIAQQVADAFALDWYNVGWQIAQGIAAGLAAGSYLINSAATQAAQAAMDAAQGELGIESPSQRAADEIGLPFVAGIAQGIRDAGQVQAAISSLVNVAMPQMAMPQMAAAGGGNNMPQTINIHVKGRVENETITVDLRGGVLSTARARGIR